MNSSHAFFLSEELDLAVVDDADDAAAHAKRIALDRDEPAHPAGRVDAEQLEQVAGDESDCLGRRKRRWHRYVVPKGVEASVAGCIGRAVAETDDDALGGQERGERVLGQGRAGERPLAIPGARI